MSVVTMQDLPRTNDIIVPTLAIQMSTTRLPVSPNGSAINQDLTHQPTHQLPYTGLILDTILKVGPRMASMPSNPGYIFYEWVTLAIMDFSNMDEGTFHPNFLYPISNISPIEACWRTLIRNSDDEGNVPEDLYLGESRFGSWYRACSRARGGNWSYWDRDESVPGQPVKAFEGWATRASMGKMFFRGEGKFVGTTEGDVRVGDVVCAIRGVESPVVLRKIEREEQEGDSWERVGDAWVFGVMDGEAWGLGIEERAFVVV